MIRPQLLRAIIGVNILTLVVIFATFVYFGIDAPGGGTCVTKFIDFHAIWGAARIALEGQAILAFEREALEQAYSACDQVNMYWLYPAPMVPLVMPFGLLPFMPAFYAFLALSIAALAISMRPFLVGNRAALLAFVSAPAWLPALVIGQVTLLWCAGLLAAISAMRADRPILAGCFIGLLTLKPTLGLLVPVILLADRRYATIGAATVATLVLHLGAMAFYGFDYLPAWITASSIHGASLAENLAVLDAMGSVAVLAAKFGAPARIALLINAAVLLGAAIILWFIWRRFGAHSDGACAALCAAIPLSTPYLWHNDAAFSALTALFLFRAGLQKRSQGWWIIIALLWMGPGLTIWNSYTLQIAGLSPPLIDPVMLFLGFVVSIFFLRTTFKQPTLQREEI
ncbi:glycosyltransferase family 87 protein [Cognatiyoonia sp. IB215446]|uniref:glycosyltransferase family 87 protein n=1 Tax=Cognatiyoonia sp. IB215446 TaxID=3097355 RepID=UPI002A1441C0|nr:glycosyltransferase family 87 protein [Cognatiyoonia sp. IB215446]MDX8349688.1 glycosyltransferase family 87 protein [Cognatiyoonia sp. IB215446]